MTRTTYLALALLTAPMLGCGQGSGENKDQARTGDRAADKTSRTERAKMATRDDWQKDVAKEEKGRPVGKIDSQVLEGKIKSVEADRNAVTFDVKGQEYTLRVAPDAVFEEGSTRSFAVRGGLAGFAAGNRVLISTFKRDDQDIVVRIKLLSRN